MGAFKPTHIVATLMPEPASPIQTEGGIITLGKAKSYDEDEGRAFNSIIL